jgi:hypothetical protein
MQTKKLNEILNNNNNNNINYKLADCQVVGLIDSDGGFEARLQNNSLVFTLKLTQRDYSVEMLHAVQAYFGGVGNIVIDNAETGSLKLTIHDRKILLRIAVPLFDKYPLLTSRYLDYQD